MSAARVAGSALLFAAGALACTGGRGALSGELDTWDEAAAFERPAVTGERAASRERAAPTREGAGTSSEPAPGTVSGAGAGAGTGGLDCSGRYVCVIGGGKDTDTETFRPSANGGCTVDDFVLEADGRVTAKGTAVGTWSVSGGVVTITGQAQIVCAKPATTSGSTPTTSSASSSGNVPGATDTPAAAVRDAGS